MKDLPAKRGISYREKVDKYIEIQYRKIEEDREKFIELKNL